MKAIVGSPGKGGAGPRLALSGVRVLELSGGAGAVGGRILADLGAEVIKVEPPGGEEARWAEPAADLPNGERTSLFWLAYNVGKRSLCLDLDSAEGRRLWPAVARTADIVITDYQRFSIAENDRLAAVARAANPALIWTEIWPFGRGQPYENYPAGDLVVQALGGHLCLNGDLDRPPVGIGLPVAILNGGSEAASAALMAYYHRLHGGPGQRVDISMQECITWTLLNTVMIWQILGINEIRGGAVRKERTNNFYTRLVWECADGFITIAPVGGGFGIVRERSYAALVAWMAEDGITDELLTSRDWNGKDASKISQEDYDRVAEIIAGFIRTKTKKALMERAVRDQILLAPINGVRDVLENDHLRERGLYAPVRDDERGTALDYPVTWANLSATPLRHPAPAPQPGEFDAVIRAELDRAAVAAEGGVT
ncbi:MAG TPA: CoA transferase [Hyphomicrobiales bacterium]|nr:CoA transferase [Hyphomicrobiales bacterium]